MHWQLSIALLLATFVSLAHCHCEIFADQVKFFDNRGVATYGVQVNITVKTEKSGTTHAMQAAEKKFVKKELSKGASFMGLRGANVDSQEEYEVHKQVNLFTTRYWAKMADQAMGKVTEISERHDVPAKHITNFFQLHLVCGAYEMFLPKIVVYKSM